MTHTKSDFEPVLYIDPLYKSDPNRNHLSDIGVCFDQLVV